jgi:hypothetical protein
MARRALPLGVAARAEVARAGRSYTMLADEVSVVNEVIVGRYSLVAQIDVAAVAVAHRPLVAVLVASEAGGHLRQDGLRTRFGHVGMAPNAIAVDRTHVAWVIESKLRACELRHLAYVRFAVTQHARSIVVGLLVASPADGVGRKMDRSRVSSERDPYMAFDAVDALEHVGAVLERVRRQIMTNAEHAGARRERDRHNHPERETHPHRVPEEGPGGAAVSGPPSA